MAMKQLTVSVCSPLWSPTLGYAITSNRIGSLELKENAFDVERYMSTRPAIVKPDEPFDIYEIDLSDEDAAAE